MRRAGIQSSQALVLFGPLSNKHSKDCLAVQFAVVTNPAVRLKEWEMLCATAFGVSRWRAFVLDAECRTKLGSSVSTGAHTLDLADHARA
jgi:hypothetical protein